MSEPSPHDAARHLLSTRGQSADVALAEYALNLMDRWDTSAIVPRHSITVPGYTAELNACHANVTKLVLAEPSMRAVRGWLLFDYRMFGAMGGEPWLEFLAHSVIETESGARLDITPAQTPYGEPDTYPFLEHLGSEDEYAAVVEDRRISRLRVFILYQPFLVTFL